MESTYSIEVNSLKFSWNKPSDPVIDIPHWNIKRNDSVFLFGPSGSGKSTLLNLLSGIIVPDKGCIKILGESISDMRANARDKYRAKHIGVIFQQFNLLPYLNVLDNIRLGPFFSANRDVDTLFLEHILDTLELSQNQKILQSKAKNLSVGQQQRVAVARALVNKPEIIIADEPTSALDSSLRDQFIDLLFKVTQELNSTVVFVSHDRSLASHFDSQVNLDEINLATGKSEC